MGVNRKREDGKGNDVGMGGEGKEGDFQKFELLTASMLSSANLHHRAKFRAGRSRRSEDMAVYRIFQDGGHTLLRAKMRHRVKFCADRTNRLGNMAVFDVSRWRPSAVLDFKKLEILTARYWLAGSYRRRNHLCHIL